MHQTDTIGCTGCILPMSSYWTCAPIEHG